MPRLLDESLEHASSWIVTPAMIHVEADLLVGDAASRHVLTASF
jgi:hypothetical protein